jgi:anti-anti-sigma factor
MQARLKTQNGIAVVALSGRVDVETALPFRAACLREFKGKRLVFDFSALNFVGSQGLLPFLETFQEFYESAPGSFKFSGVSVEFRQLFSATPLYQVEIYESVDVAVMAFFVPAAAPASPVEAAALAQQREFIAYRSEPSAADLKSTAPESDDEIEA